MTAAPDRHLLFGLLALLNGLIDQGQLVAAFQAWTRDKSRSLADHLEARGDLTGAKRVLLDALAEVHLEAHDGDVEKSLAAVPANRSTRASLAELGEPEIEATLAQVTRIKNGQATEADGDDDPDRTVCLSLGEPTSDGQRFRLLRPHARGGLGEVFVALDAELHREVALKQMLDKHADDPVSRWRFIAEAEITGGLEHPGVVPVYGLGTTAGGRPYYAMRFIKGDSLKEAIEKFHGDDTLKNNAGRRSLELRKLLRRFLEVCDAIGYAHSRGVIHRDIKPANIILGNHGETLVVDWGVAKAIGRADPSSGDQTIAPSSSASAETLPGSALGTPAYMSPEQASGDLDRVGPRSDVYSLGATLYCLLTGKPPYEGDDVGEILRRVQKGEFERPRAVDSSLDKALEAVCLKAMANSREDRYPSCRALAEDVDRWMADQPVSAWAEPWTRKLLRWLTRHRTSVTGTAAAVLAGVVGLLAVLAVQARDNAQLSASLTREMKASTALAAANAKLVDEQAKVQERFELAQKAIGTFHTGVSEDMLLKNDQFKELRTRLLKEAAGFYADLENLLASQTDTRSRKALAAGIFELAELTDKIGSQQEALAVHRKALAIRRELADEPGADVETRLDVARSLCAIGLILRKTIHEAGALTAFEEARVLAERLEVDDPTDAVRSVLARSQNHIGSVLYLHPEEQAAALSALRNALSIQQRLAAANSSVPRFQTELAETHNFVGHVLRSTGRPTEALEAHRKALAIIQKLADANRTVASLQMELAGTYNNIGYALARSGKPSEALEAQWKALAIRQRLVDANPAVSRLQDDLGWCHIQIGGLLLRTGKRADALGAYGKALATYGKIVNANPDNTAFLSDLAWSHIGIGRVHALDKQFAEALTALDTGLAILLRLAHANPEDAEAAGGLGYGYAIRGWARARAGLNAEAAADLRKAVEPGNHFSHVDDLWVPQSEVRFGLAQALALLAGLRADPKAGVTAAEASKFAEQAVAALRTAVSAGWADLDQLKEPDFDSLRERADFQKLVVDLEAKIGPKARPGN
jgi:serine/threonine-protein kinase